MLRRSNSRTKKKSTPTSALNESASARLSLGNDLVDSSSEEEKEETIATVPAATARHSTSRTLASVMDHIRKQAAITRVQQASATTTSPASTNSPATVTGLKSTPQNRFSSPASDTNTRRNNFLSTSPESLTNSTTSPQVSPASDRDSSVHSVRHVGMENDDDGGVGDASSHSDTEGDNAKSQRLLGHYFASLKQSGTTRNVVEEKDMITTKLSIVFKRIKFVDSDSELSSTGNIALFLYKELRVPDNYREVWWEQMKKHVRKKLDERRSNCGTAFKKTIISKWNILWCIFFISNHSHFFLEIQC